MVNDIGRFVGRYLQTLACLSIASMFISAALFDTLNVDFTVVFLFWAAAYLVKHHPSARKLTIGVCVLVLLGLGALSVYAAVAGTDQIILRVGGARVEHPSMLTVTAVCSVMVAVVGLPLVLLLTPQARREFG